ncbi:MAG: Gfo/Idh/MocA family oxidoreductase [Planctomycetes bacterium]|nr:Gfo/Idh/MocA family oxidoreductase [Planctomycetota bacterium]
MAQRSSRRSFLKTSTLAGAGFWVAARPTFAQSRSPNEKLNAAAVGAGGKGGGDIRSMADLGCNVVALCDVDDNNAQDTYNKFPDAKRFHDFREMFDKMHKDIDVVTVSTPDHMHAVASMMAMKLGKHVYTQKPLTHDVYEARMLTEEAKKGKVVTQMGNQGSAADGLRQAVEVVQSGAIGLPREVHVWTNRAGTVWPQGARGLLGHQGIRAALTGKGEPATPPSHVAWALWLGTAPHRPYDPCYAPFRWRGWLDYGTGALGDMACHTANMAFRACNLGYPTTIEAETSETNDQTYPLWSVIRYEFPARQQQVPGRGTVELPPLKWTWYDGGNDKPAWVGKKIVELAQGMNVPLSGSLIIGDKGTLYSPDDYGSEYHLLPKADFEGYKPPTPWVPRVNGQHDREFIQAIKDNKPEACYSNFTIAGPLTETVVLGCVALRAGRKIEWDGPNMKITNVGEIGDKKKKKKEEDAVDPNTFLRREYRKGYEL